MTISKILTVEEAAELLNVRPSWLYARTCDGAQRGSGRGRPRTKKSIARPHPAELFDRIPHFKFGRLLRFDRDELLTWLASMHRNGEMPSVSVTEGQQETALSQ